MLDPKVIISVLVVDDEPDNLAVVAETLAFMGLVVRSGKNGREGLDVLQDFIPDLILLDLSMPQMDGWEMCSILKANPETRNIPVVALSAHAMAGDREKALAAGFDGYLPKPVDITTLPEDIQRVLEERTPIVATEVAHNGGSAATGSPTADSSAVGLE
jgi:CheY-like chemotaxis protein